MRLLSEVTLSQFDPARAGTPALVGLGRRPLRAALARRGRQLRTGGVVIDDTCPSTGAVESN